MRRKPAYRAEPDREHRIGEPEVWQKPDGRTEAESEHESGYTILSGKLHQSAGSDSKYGAGRGRLRF